MAQRSNKDRVLAEISWIERPIGNKRLEDTNFYKQIGEKCPLEEKIRRLQVFWMLNETFPFYLPQRYHAMDCLALHNNSKDGNYWANASVFLFNTATYGHRFLAKIDAFLKVGAPDLKSLSQATSHYKTIKQKYLKGSLEECESAAEFLLDPWVLLQLPLQPMIAYQWAVALLAEALRFEKEIHQIAHLACRKQLTVPIKKLSKLQSKLLAIAENQIGIVYGYTKGQGYNYQSYLKAYKKDYLVSGYPVYLPILEFVLSQKCRDVIKSMKRLALKNSANESDRSNLLKVPTKCRPFPFGNYNTFWAKKEKLDDLLPLGKVVEDLDSFLKFGEQEDPVEHLKQFVDETINHTGHLEEADKQDVLGEILAVKDELPDFGEFLSLAALINKHTGAQKTGIISNIITLRMEAAKAEISTKWTDVLDSVLEPYRWEIVNADNFQTAEYNIRQISDILSKVHPDQKWCYKNILKKVKASFVEKLMEFPDFDQGAEKIAIHLQERIRRIVLKMIERHYDSLKEKNFAHFPECQFVQLILPCFVASFLDLDKDASASEETKRKYFEFVHELVKSYERTEFSYKILAPVEFVPFAGIVYIGFVTPYLQDRCQSVEKVLRQLLGNSKIYDDFISKGVSSNFVFRPVDHNAECYIKAMNWSNLVFMFNSRVRSVLLKMGYPDDPELIFTEKNVIFPESDELQNITMEQLKILKTHEFVKQFVGSTKQDEELDKLFDFGVPSEMIEGALTISAPNLDGLVLHLLVKYFAEEKTQTYKIECIEGPGFPLDPLASALWFLSSNDLWKFKLQLAKIFTLREGNEDPTLVPFEVAESNLCYQTILKSITPDGKVQMSRPGEITFFPLKHCRWCGQVKVEQFRVCPVCSETPDYPDLILFCSEKCEKEALEKQHEEEHINFLMEQCGINN